MSKSIEMLMKEVDINEIQMTENNTDFFNEKGNELLKLIQETGRDDYRKENLIKAFIIFMSLTKDQMEKWEVNNEQEGIVYFFIQLFSCFKDKTLEDFCLMMKEMTESDVKLITTVKVTFFSYLKLSYIVMGITSMMDETHSINLTDDVKMDVYHLLGSRCFVEYLGHEKIIPLRERIKSNIHSPDFIKNQILNSIVEKYR